MVRLIGLTRTLYCMWPHKQGFLPDVTFLIVTCNASFKRGNRAAVILVSSGLLLIFLSLFS